MTVTYMAPNTYECWRNSIIAQVQNHILNLTLLEVNFKNLEICFKVKDLETINWDDLSLLTMSVKFMNNSSYGAMEAKQMLLRVFDDIVCLAFKDSGRIRTMILGNTSLQRTRLTYDLSARTIGFQYHSCL
ncbi:hypothetical protein SLE2022_145450 [Rubroshorea leprosula]